MPSYKCQRFWQYLIAYDLLSEPENDLYNTESIQTLHPLVTLFMLSFQVMVLASIQFDFSPHTLRIIVCTFISILLNLLCYFTLFKNAVQFRNVFFTSLIVLWIGLFQSCIDTISEQLLQKSIIIMEIQLYFCFFIVFRNHNVRMVILTLAYLRILIGFQLQNLSVNRESLIGLITFILSYIFLVVFFRISKQNNKMCSLQKNKEQLRYQELENILNNDIQQGIMIVTPKTTESLLSLQDLKVKYVNNCFLNQFNVSRSEALHILPNIYASSIKHFEEGEQSVYVQKDSAQMKQQFDQDAVQREQRDKACTIGLENTFKKNQTQPKSITSVIKNQQTQIKPAIKMNKTPGGEYNPLHDQKQNDVVFSIAESTKIVNEEIGDTVHNLPPQYNLSKKFILSNNNSNNNINNNNNNINNQNSIYPSTANQINGQSLNSTMQPEHSQHQLAGLSKFNSQSGNTSSQYNNLEKRQTPQQQSHQKIQNYKQQVEKTQSSLLQQKKQVIKIKNQISLDNENKFNDILINKNKNQIMNQNANGMIIREGSNKNIHATTVSRSRLDSNPKIKGSLLQNQQQQPDGYVNLLDRINYYHQKYLQKKEKNISFSQRNASDDQRYTQSLIIWEYKREDKINSNEDNQAQQDQFYDNNRNNAQHTLQNNISYNPYQMQVDGKNNNLIPYHPQRKMSDPDHHGLNYDLNQPLESEKVHLKMTTINSPLQGENQIMLFQNNLNQEAQNKTKNAENINNQNNQQGQNENKYSSIYNVPSSFRKQSPAKKPSQIIQENTETNNNNMRTLSNSQRPSNATLNNLQQEYTKASQNNNSLNKSKRRISNLGNDRLVSRKIDENIVEITRDKRNPSENGVAPGERRDQVPRNEEDDEEDWDNGIQYLEIKLFECEMDKEESIMVIVNNINQRMKYERLEEIQTKNEQMLANVTHDLKTPLNCMTLMVEGMKIDKEYNEVTLNMILENANLLMCLIQDILDYSQIKKGKLRLVQSYFQVSEIISEVIHLFQMQADQKNIKLISNIYVSSTSSINTSLNGNQQNNTNGQGTQTNYSICNLNAGSLQQLCMNNIRNPNNSLATNIELQTMPTIPNNINQNNNINNINSNNNNINNNNINNNNNNINNNNNGDGIKNIQMHQDKNRIKQILINLISNALKFTQEGSIEIRCDLKDMEEHCSIKIVEFTVKDTGVGMNPHIKSQLFKMFNTFDQKGLNKNGIGLGLTICKRLVTFLGPSDHIDVESEESKGSSFTFKVFKDLNDIDNTHHTYSDESDESPDINNKQMFHDLAKSIKQNYLIPPLQKDEDQIDDSQIVVNTLPTSVARPTIPFLKMIDTNKNNLNILNILGTDETPSSKSQILFNMLIVDDQPFNIVAFKLILKNFKQISITEAYNGKDAFEKYQKQKYHFVLMDYNMPIMNGCESTKLIRLYEMQNNLSPCKIIIVSGFDEHQKEYNKAMQGGADDYLTKPVNFKILSEKLNTYMNKQN